MGFRDEVTDPQEMGILGLSEYAVGLGALWLLSQLIDAEKGCLVFRIGNRFRRISSRQKKTVMGFLFMGVLGQFLASWLSSPAHRMYVSCPLSFPGRH